MTDTTPAAAPIAPVAAPSTMAKIEAEMSSFWTKVKTTVASYWAHVTAFLAGGTMSHWTGDFVALVKTGLSHL